MHAYRNCVQLTQRIDREYKFEIIDTERKEHQESVEGTHLSAKLKRWDSAADEAFSTAAPFSILKRMKTEIQNWNDDIFSGGINGCDITKLYSDFSELMHLSFKDRYFEAPLDARYYEPIVYKPEFIKSKTVWLDCLVEMGKYIMYLEEYSVLHPRFTRFRNDMKEDAAEEQHEEEEDGKEEVIRGKEEWPEFGDDRHATQMSGMLYRLNNL